MKNTKDEKNSYGSAFLIIAQRLDLLWFYQFYCQIPNNLVLKWIASRLFPSIGLLF